MCELGNLDKVGEGAGVATAWRVGHITGIAAPGGAMAASGEPSIRSGHRLR